MISIDYKQRRDWIVRGTYEIIQSLAQVCLIKINVDIYQTLKVVAGLGDQKLTVRAVDSCVSIVNSVVLALLTGRCLKIDSLLGDHLEGGEGEGASFDGVGGSNDVGIGIGDVGVGVGILEGCGVSVERPAGDVDLFAFADGIGLEEGVHVFWSD